jgi:hypothetical protein
MKYLVKTLLTIFIAVSIFLIPSFSDAEPAKQSECMKMKNSDDKNLCLSKSKDEDKAYGYTNKDHSHYYCTLIRNRDKQNFCYALANTNPNMCALIVDKKLEDQCNAHFKS